MMELSAIRVSQNGRDMFLCRLTVDELMRISEIPRYNPNTGRGYQREPRPERLTNVGTFIQSYAHAVFPTAVLLSVHKKPTFVQHRDGSGTLRLSDSSSLAIVDGQTRILGLNKLGQTNAEFLEFELAVIIAHFPTQIEEAINFRTINREAKRVETQLTDRLIAQQMEHGHEQDLGVLAPLLNSPDAAKNLRKWDIIRIAIAMGSDSNSPWNGKIRLPNSTGPYGPRTREGTFIRTLAPAVRAMDGVHWGLCVKHLIAYWQAVYSKSRPADQNSEKYPYLARPVAAYVGHILFKEIYNRVETPTKAAYLRALRPVTRLNKDLWRDNGPLQGIAGGSSYARAAANLTAQL